MFLGSVFKAIFGFALKVFQTAQKHGLTDALVKQALTYAREAAERFVDTAERREWVVAQLRMKLKVPESLARLALELAIQQLKDEAES